MHEFVRFLIFGLPTWALVDGTWSILYQLAINLPEGYQISAYLMLALTIGNFFPIVLGSMVLPRASSRTGHLIIILILLFGFVVGILLSIFWKSVLNINGRGYSVPLYCLFFVAGSCASSSNVTHFSMVSLWPAKCTTFLATGMGLGSMISGILAILQGSLLLKDGFTVGIYYFVVSLLYLPALAAVHSLRKEGPPMIATKFIPMDDVHISSAFDNLLQTECVDATVVPSLSMDLGPNDFLNNYFFIFFLQFFNSSLGYGLVPSIISSVCGKYSRGSAILLYATGITAVVDPFSRALTNIARFKTTPSFFLASGGLGCLSLALVTILCLPSSTPLFKGSGFGTVIAYVGFNALNVFTNTCIFRFIKEHAPDAQVQACYRRAGIFSQSGALVGTAISFAVVVSGVLG